MKLRSFALAFCIATAATGCQKKEPQKSPEEIARAEARKLKAEKFRELQKQAKERQEAAKNEPPPPSRCGGQMAKELRLVKADPKGDRVIWSKTNSDVVFAAGAVTPERSGKKLVRRTWIPLTAVVPEKENFSAIEVVPCVGEPVRIEAADLKADPERYRLTLNRRGALKLLNIPAAETTPAATGPAAPAADPKAADKDPDETDDEGDAGSGPKTAGEKSPLKKGRRDVGRNLYEFRLIP